MRLLLTDNVSFFVSLYEGMYLCIAHPRNKPLPNKQRGSAEHQGAPRNATEREGTPKFPHPALESERFRWIPPQIIYYLWRPKPLPQRPTWTGVDPRNYQTRGSAEHHGTLRNLTDRLNLDTPPWNPPPFGGFLPNYLIFPAPNSPFPAPNLEWRRNTKKPHKQRDPAEHHGARRNTKERLNSATPRWNRPYFGGVIPNFLIVSAPDAPIPAAQLGKAVKYETTEQTKGRRVTPRNVSVRLNFAIPPWNPPYYGGVRVNSLIFLAPDAPFPTPNWARRRNTKLPHKQRGSAERDGSPKFRCPALEPAIFR